MASCPCSIRFLRPSTVSLALKVGITLDAHETQRISFEFYGLAQTRYEPSARGRAVGLATIGPHRQVEASNQQSTLADVTLVNSKCSVVFRPRALLRSHLSGRPGNFSRSMWGPIASNPWSCAFSPHLTSNIPSSPQTANKFTYSTPLHPAGRPSDASASTRVLPFRVRQRRILYCNCTARAQCKYNGMSDDRPRRWVGEGRSENYSAASPRGGFDRHSEMRYGHT